MNNLRSQVRVAQTVDEIDRLRAEFDFWKARRDLADVRKQYVTQLQALSDVVTRALADVRSDTLAILDDHDIGSVYQRCSLQDKRVLWIRRVLWGFYREKFDQRDGTGDLQTLLEAADDVVWSCYQEAFRQLPPTCARGPIPLAYVEPFYSPQALPRDEVPGILKDKRLGDRFLAEFFTKLPIPLISLPPSCVAAPWWLIYLAHEVGHHVQHDLELVDAFSALLEEVVTSGGAPTTDSAGATRWTQWGQEIFSDVFAVFTMGAPAVVAMIELETHPADDMMISKDNYPAPAVRLALLAAVARQLGLKPQIAPPPQTSAARRTSNDPFVIELQQQTRADLAMLGKVAAAVTSRTVGSLATLRKLSGWNDADLTAGGTVDTWQKALILNNGYPIQRQLSAARIIVSASVGAWQQLAAIADAKRRARAMTLLRPRVLNEIDRTRDEATRAGDQAAVRDVSSMAEEISQGLRRADFFEW